MTALRAPFPYPGGKRLIAHAVWEALGNPRLYVEPFCGSAAVLLGRPHEPGLETVNDADGLVCNAWRGIRLQPEATARHADWPVSEIDLHARHRVLVQEARAGKLAQMLDADPEYCDPRIAGWWIWGASQWIGGGWCADHAAVVPRRRPNITTAGSGTNSPSKATWRQRPSVTCSGNGVNAVTVQRQIPQAHGIGGGGVHGHRVETGHGITGWFEQLSARLRKVRILCGDFSRVLTKSTLYVEGSNVCGVFLDPPYTHEQRATGLYAHDAADVGVRAREWALANGENPRLRIVLAGLDGEHEMPGWRSVAWKGHFGLGRSKGNENRAKERLWLSPHCVRSVQLDMWKHETSSLPEVKS